MNRKSWTTERSNFFMSKITNEQRIEIYKKKKIGYSYSQLSLEYGINKHIIEYLVRIIDKHGFDVLRKDSNKYYSKEFKEAAIKRVLEDGETVESVSIDLGLLNHGILFNWIKSYKENGYNVVEKKRGRHAKEENDCHRTRNQEYGTREENQGIRREEPPLNSRERVHKKIRCLSYGTKEERIQEIVKAIQCHIVKLNALCHVWAYMDLIQNLKDAITLIRVI